MLEHHATIAHTAKGTNSDVGTICDEAKNCEKHCDSASDGETPRKDPPDGGGYDAAKKRAKPNDNGWARIRGNVSTRNREGMKHNACDSATGGQRADDVPKFVNGHHCKPAERQERGDEYELVKTVH